LAEPAWHNRLEEEEEDLRALTPLLYGHVNPYGCFYFDMDERISINE
jgi:hypothetical protein